MEKILPTTRRPDVTFHASGQICITARIARLLDLTSRSCVNIAVRDGEYLLHARPVGEPTAGRHAARCYCVNSRGRYFRANSVRLCRAVLRECARAEGSPAFLPQVAALMCGAPVTIDGRTHIPIITRRNLHENS